MSAIAIAALALSGCKLREDVTVAVDPSVQFQTIEAWSVVPRLWEFDKDANRFNDSWLNDRDAILEKLITEFGVTRMRVEIRSGAENPVDYWPDFASRKMSYEDYKSRFYEKINDDDDPAHLNPKGIQFSELDFRIEQIVLPAMAIAEKHGRKLDINLNYVDFKWTAHKGSLSHADNPAEYAELIAATWNHLKTKYGIEPGSLEIILEPDNSDKWRGPQIGRAMLATAARFRNDGRKVPPMISPSTALAGRALGYVDGILQVPGALPLLSTISYHRYDTFAGDDTIRKIGRRAKALGKTTAMLEHVEGDAAELLQDLTEANASSWLQWGVAWNGLKDGYPIIVDESAQGGNRLRFSPIGQQLALVFTQVRPGAVRVGASSNSGELRSAAFRSPEGDLTLLLAAAPPPGGSLWNKAMKRLSPNRSYTVRLSGLGSGTLLVRSATRSGDVRDCMATNGDVITIETGELATVRPAPRGSQAAECR